MLPRLLEKAYGTEVVTNIVAVTDAIKEQIATLERGYKEQQLRVTRLKAGMDWIDFVKQKTAEYGTWEAFLDQAYLNMDKLTQAQRDQLNTLYDQLDSYQEQLQETLTGTTAQSISDAITDGLREGLDSAEVFAGTFEDLMKNALWQAFNRQIMTKMLEPWYAEFAGKATGGLTSAEIEQLQESFIGMSGGVKDAYDAIQRIATQAGIDLIGGIEKKAKLTGAIQGMSEQTAGLLAGQFNAIRTDTATIKNIVNSMSETARLTAERVSVRGGLYDRLNTINAYLFDIKGKNIQMRDSLSVVVQTGLDNLRANQETAVNTRYLKSIDTKLTKSSPFSLPGLSNRAIGI